MSILDLVIIFWGGFATVSAFTVSMYFFRSNVGIGRAVAIDKLAEATNMAIIVIFSMSYMNHGLENLSPLMMYILRSIGIAATTMSTIHLAIQTIRIVQRHEE